ncbi:hypothetical protein [Pseudovibrio sp. Ad26]|uniref:hypothetical protein n=1 Tax=Pseudovibrio sp. Ad26 TaxID=989410 RepID=UPI0007AE68C6|nr:hypothetical protein [Pseudovibrio sp. Ad26]KZL10689.1 hypothetical protein PsAD26_03054 [Pseudovibrio sp. Ad26]
MSSSTARYWGLVVVCFAAFFMGGLLTVVFFEFQLAQFGLCTGVESEVPWSCGRKWLGALSGWAAAIAAVSAAIYAGSLVKVQIDRTEDQIDKTVEANSIARQEFMGKAAQFISEDTIKCTRLTIHYTYLIEEDLTMKAQNVAGILGSYQILKKNSMDAITFLPYEVWEKRNDIIEALEEFFELKYEDRQEITEAEELNDIIDRLIATAMEKIDNADLYDYHRLDKLLDEYRVARVKTLEDIKKNQKRVWGQGG